MSKNHCLLNGCFIWRCYEYLLFRPQLCNLTKRIHSSRQNTGFSNTPFLYFIPMYRCIWMNFSVSILPVYRQLWTSPHLQLRFFTSRFYMQSPFLRCETMTIALRQVSRQPYKICGISFSRNRFHTYNPSKSIIYVHN